MADKKTLWTTLVSGIAVGAACAAVVCLPPVRALEQEVGLRWLFKLRGAEPAPEQVVMVTMNRRAAANISLPRDAEKFHRCEGLVIGPAPATHVTLPSIPSRWPRCLHAQLVNKLVSAGAGAIAFDVLFRERPPLPGDSADLQRWQDEDFAATLAAAKRVVVAQKLEVFENNEAFTDLSPAIADAALGSAPLPLVADAGRRIDRFLAFTDSGHATPTLPTIALQAHLLDAFTPLSELLARNAGDVAQLLPPTADSVRADRQLQATVLLIRRLFRDDPGLAPRLLAEIERAKSADPESNRPLRTLISLYADKDARIINFYGPPKTIRSVSYDDVLASSSEDLSALVKGRAVFIGFAEFDQPEQVEHFATAVSSGRGIDMSGVEIAATGFANLLRGESIRELPLAYWVAIVFVVALLTTVICDRFENKTALALTLVVMALYASCALYEFSRHNLWMPLVMPILVAAPAAILSSFSWKYWTARRQREQLRRAFSYFVPREVVNLLEHNAEQIGGAKESLECACVATDAANYTPLAETMSPEQLAEFLNRYFEALFGGVANRGGFVSDVVGDAMLALWPHRSDETRRQMLHALLEMRDAADRFSEQLVGHRLVTRFGADWGRVALTTVGAGAHYEYRAVGDAVNTAGRIQELNKKLGSRILVSRPAIGAAEGEFLVRDLGSFLLRGKSNAVHIYELMGTRARATAEQLELCVRFAEAVAALGDSQAGAAVGRFREIHAAFPEDAPTTFFLRGLESGLSLERGAVVVG
ncbi:MAG TPA: adenylate/guanylate cyclase domain-containing protein [Steroidobacteraceae bacterium]|nr:adenylate/guanylate cyclase domain-containing protein [Steroidobacteraceae bacterium]